MILIHHFNDKTEKQSLSDYSQSHLEASHNIIRSDSVPPQVSLCAENINPRDAMINLDLKRSTWDQDLFTMKRHRQ